MFNTKIFQLNQFLSLFICKKLLRSWRLSQRINRQVCIFHEIKSMLTNVHFLISHYTYSMRYTYLKYAWCLRNMPYVSISLCNKGLTMWKWNANFPVCCVIFSIISLEISLPWNFYIDLSVHVHHREIMFMPRSSAKSCSHIHAIIIIKILKLQTQSNGFKNCAKLIKCI